MVDDPPKIAGRYTENGKELKPPHTHKGYEHYENGTRRTNRKEKKMVERVNKLLYDNIK